MKKTVLLIMAVFTMSATLQAQKVGYVNTQTILKEIPEYNVAQQQIERMQKQYEAQVQTEMKKVEELYNRYQKEKGSMSQTERSEREKEIITLERAAKEMQRNFFGQEGAMAVRSKELLDPVMKKVQSIVKEVADSEEIIIIFDISTAQGIIYNNPAYDLTRRVIDKINQY